MEHAFFTVLNMSVAGGIAILLAVVLRLILRRGPKWAALLIWGVVALRLTIPVFFESRLAPIPAASFAAANGNVLETPVQKEPDHTAVAQSGDTYQSFLPVQTPGYTQKPIVTPAATPTSAVSTPRPTGEVQATAAPDPTASPADDPTTAPAAAASTDDDPGAPSGRGPVAVRILFAVWLTGCGAMLLYALVSYFLLKRKLAYAVLLREGIYESEYARSPFTLGIFKPNIYVPFSLDEKRLSYVLRHEKAHLGAADQFTKALGFAVLSLHWFNPLVWLAYTLFCRDLELACDERVIKRLSEKERVEYSQTLLDLSERKHSLGVTPLAFGEGDAKARIKSILNYRKPKVALIVLAVLLTCVLAACTFTANKPKDANSSENSQAAAAETPSPADTPAPTSSPAPTAEPIVVKTDIEEIGYLLAPFRVGDGEGQISIDTDFFEDDVSRGPEDFVIEDGDLWVLDSAAPVRRVLCLEFGTLPVHSYPINPGYRPGQLVRLCVGSEKIYVIDLMGRMYVLDRESGELTSTVQLPTGEGFFGDGFAGSIVYMKEENGRLNFTVRTYTDTRTFFTAYAYDPESEAVVPTGLGVSGENMGVHYTFRDTRNNHECSFDLPAGWMFTEFLGFLPDGSCYISAIHDADTLPYPRKVFCFHPDGSLLYQSHAIGLGTAPGEYDIPHFRLGDGFGVHALMYKDGAFDLVSLKMFEDPADIRTEIIVSGSRYKSGYYEFRSLGEELLRGERVGDVDFSYLDQCVFFRLDEDALRAYSELTTISRYHSLTGELDTYSGYSGLIAEYPLEVGEMADQKLIEYANSYLGWGLSGNENFVSQGLVGDGWFALTTVDETIQDIQVHCIFRYDGTEWREFPGNNGGLHLDNMASEYGVSFPTYAITVINKDVALLGYSSKFLWDEETGWSHPYVYRTANGGRSWEKLDLVLPDEFISDVAGYQMIQPAFDGAHGVLPLVCHDGGRVVWFETFDYGASWTYHE